MKLRSTTPVYIFSRVLRYVTLAIIPVVVISGIAIQLDQPTEAVDNSKTQARIDELTKEIEKNTSNGRSLNEQSSSIESQLAATRRETTYLQQHLSSNQTNLESTKRTIEQGRVKLSQQRELLGQVLVDNYIDGSVSPIEMLASSDNVAGYIERLELQDGLRNQLNDTVAALRQTQDDLSKKEKELASIIGTQENQNIALRQKSAEQDTLLAAVNGQSSQLTKYTAVMAAERKQLQTQQQSSLSQAMSGAQLVTGPSISQPVTVAPKPEVPVVTPQPVSPTTPAPTQPVSPPKPVEPPAPVVLPNGGYPINLQNCYVDSNALSYGFDAWGYGCRQCVSYTAWKVLQKTGRAPMYWGNAKDWPASARRAGYSTGSSPRVGSVGVMTTGPYGHVVWVESINGNGTINISQYNYWLAGKSNGGWGWYSEFKNVSPSTYQAYIYV